MYKYCLRCLARAARDGESRCLSEDKLITRTAVSFVEAYFRHRCFQNGSEMRERLGRPRAGAAAAARRAAARISDDTSEFRDVVFEDVVFDTNRCYLKFNYHYNSTA